MTSLHAFRDSVQAAGHRFTPERRAVAALVAAHRGTFTPGELLGDARRHELGIGRATLFRALDLFRRLGLIEHIDLPGGGHAYVTCESPRHHHLVCSSCGQSIEVRELDLSSGLAQVADRTAYRVDRHRLELFGVCRACQPTHPARPDPIAGNESRRGVSVS
jgi:Fur family ferric uptake transcriptional regulator